MATGQGREEGGEDVGGVGGGRHICTVHGAVGAHSLGEEGQRVVVSATAQNEGAGVLVQHPFLHVRT